MQLYNDDCLNVLKNIPDGSIDLVVTDPPYNIKKANWDTWKTIQDYVDFMGSVFLEFQRVLKDTGSFYFFHNDFMQIVELQKFINDNTNFIFRQFIVWNKRFDGSSLKTFLDGYVHISTNRNYKKMAEYILYYTLQDENGVNKAMGTAYSTTRDYLRKEIIKAKGKINLKEINKILGVATNGGGVASSILSKNKTIPNMITKENYKKLQLWLNNKNKDYEYLNKDYEYLKKDYESLKYTFNNQNTSHSVWNYDIANKNGHITPKPLNLMKNILLHSSNKGDIVLDCFMGSGTTGVACEQLNRQFIGIEIDKKYFEIAKKRIENFEKEIEYENLSLF